MSRRAALVAVVAALVAAAAAGAGGPGAAGDVRAAAELYEQSHPDPYHDVTRARYRAAVTALQRRAPGLAPDELLVELMRLGALPGVRDGHGGIYPLDSAHGRMLHLLPIRLYRFPEGVHVVAEIGRRGLVGDRARRDRRRPRGGGDPPRAAARAVRQRVEPRRPRAAVAARDGGAPRPRPGRLGGQARH